MKINQRPPMPFFMRPPWEILDNLFSIEVTTAGADTFTLPLLATGSYNFEIDWGDGGEIETITAYDQAEVTHSYTGAGVYRITIDGEIDGWSFNNSGDIDLITNIRKWGQLTFGTSAEGAFYGCSNMTVTASDCPDTTGVTSMKNMFYGCSLANPNVSGFDMSAVTTIEAMFRECTIATPSTSSWDTSSLLIASHVFYSAFVANPDVSNWDMSSVTSIASMFNSARKATPDVSNWDTSSMAGSGMAYAFHNAWDANPDVSGWDTGSVTSMRNMFYGAKSANPDISSWDTSSVTNMTNLFNGATLANPDMSELDFGSVTNLTDAFTNCGLSQTNYDALLISLADQTLQSTVTMSTVPAIYSSGIAETARADIISTYSWTITDAGRDWWFDDATPNDSKTAIVFYDGYATHYTDDGVTEAGDGDALYRISDSSGNGEHLVQETAANRPTLETNELNGYPIIRTDGSNDWADVEFVSSLDQPATFLVVHKLDSSQINDGSGRTVFDGVTSAARITMVKSGTPNPDAMGAYAGGSAIYSSSAQDANWHAYALIANGSSSVLYTDGSSVASGNIGSASITGIIIGARYDGTTNYANADIALLAVYDAALSANDLTHILSKINARYNL